MPGLHTPSGDRLSSRDKAWAIFGIFAIGLPAVVSIAIFAFGITPSFWQESRSVQSHDFSYRLRGEDWIVLFGDSYEQLWEKKQPRDLSTHGQVLDQRHGEFYWIGIHIQPEWLRQAKAEGADQLMSGYIYGTYEAYIDDRLVKTGGAGETRRPVVIELTDEMLSRPQGFPFSWSVGGGCGARLSSPGTLCPSRATFEVPPACRLAGIGSGSFRNGRLEALRGALPFWR